jgi:hypothetical protein
MDFKKATDILFSQVAHDDLARTLDVSVAAIRQARLQPEAAAHRRAPEGWEIAVKHLAEDRARHYRWLANQLGKPKKQKPRV